MTIRTAATRLRETSTVSHTIPVYTAKGMDTDVELFNTGVGKFAVKYGSQHKKGLSYEQAAKEFGLCCFHSMVNAGLIEHPGD